MDLWATLENCFRRCRLKSILTFSIGLRLGELGDDHDLGYCSREYSKSAFLFKFLTINMFSFRRISFLCTVGPCAGRLSSRQGRDIEFGLEGGRRVLLSKLPQSLSLLFPRRPLAPAPMSLYRRMISLLFLTSPRHRDKCLQQRRLLPFVMRDYRSPRPNTVETPQGCNCRQPCSRSQPRTYPKRQ